MYKNREKQRESNKESAKRYRKGMTMTPGALRAKKYKGMMEGMTELKFSKSRQAKGRLSEGI